MHHPGALEAACSLALLLAAIASLHVARRVPALRPLSAAMWALVAVEVARLWTRGSRWDVALYALVPGLQVAGAVGVVGRLGGGDERRSYAAQVPETAKKAPGDEAVATHPLLALAPFAAYAVALALWGSRLAPWWPAPLALPYLCATLAVPWGLARVRERKHEAPTPLAPHPSQGEARNGGSPRALVGMREEPSASPAGLLSHGANNGPDRAKISAQGSAAGSPSQGWLTAAALLLPASNIADGVTWIALRVLPAAEHPYDVGRVLAVVTYVVLVGVLWRAAKKST